MRKHKATLLLMDEGSINLETWLQHIADKISDQNLNIIRQAGALAQLTGSERAAPNGQACFQQGLVMAEILSELNLDNEIY